MKKLTTEDLFNLKYGEHVFRFNGKIMEPFRYVGRMPGSPELYLIFSQGERLVHQYMPTYTEQIYEWYGGDWDINFVEELEIRRLEKRLAELKKYKK